MQTRKNDSFCWCENVDVWKPYDNSNKLASSKLLCCKRMSTCSYDHPFFQFCPSYMHNAHTHYSCTMHMTVSSCRVWMFLLQYFRILPSYCIPSRLTSLSGPRSIASVRNSLDYLCFVKQADCRLRIETSCRYAVVFRYINTWCRWNQPMEKIVKEASCLPRCVFFRIISTNLSHIIC